MSKFLEGKKTYIGLVISLLGLLGFSHVISESELTSTVDSAIQLVGLVIAVYGRIVAKPSA